MSPGFGHDLDRSAEPRQLEYFFGKLEQREVPIERRIVVETGGFLGRRKPMPGATVINLERTTPFGRGFR